MPVAIALFTRDLRVHDNSVLHAALRAGARVVPLFVLDERILGAGAVSPNRARFLADCLADVDGSLRSRGAALIVRRGDPVTEVARLSTQLDVTQVHVAADVSGYAQRRQRRLARALGRRLVVHDGVVTIVPPGAITPAGRDHFAVFTPYLRQWERQPRRVPLPPPPVVRLPEGVTVGQLPRPADICPGATSPDLPSGGETAARQRMRSWLDTGVPHYAQLHDDLAADATSRLSPYLHFGCLSANELAHRVSERAGPSAQPFLRQLAWRDFYHQVLAARPQAATREYRTRNDRWRHDQDVVDAWRAGCTGYPVVDAGMRQLAQEGYLPNRARLIVASFLVKSLSQDWRLGARHFAHLLADADVANNAMNWQWIAGTGNDTRPNRVLNPLRQAERFDPQGDYVRRYLPELAGLEGATAHRPWILPEPQRRRLDYPEPIVDLRVSTQRLRRFRHAGLSPPAPA